MSTPPALGRLRPVRRIGVGGFASVWLYHDDELDSPVAVKLLADNWAQQLDIRERFLDEARVLRRADSEHVVRVYDIGTDDTDIPYFVMSYADQGTVDDLLCDSGVEPSTAVELVDQAAHGLAALHASGVVHRDVKPSNLLLCSDPQRGRRLLVADLGLAKALVHASGLTRVVGSPAYMAPEQAEVGSGLDERADVHALGAVTYRMLTGHPLREPSLGAVTANEPPVPPSQRAPVDAAVDAVVLRAVEADRDARWPDPLAFATALREAVGLDQPRGQPPSAGVPRAAAGRPDAAGRPEASVPPGPPDPRDVSVPPLRNRWFWLLVAVAMAAGYAVGYWLL